MADAADADALRLVDRGLASLERVTFAATLRVVDLGRNRLAALDDVAWAALPRLEALDASRNRLKSLPASLASLPALRELRAYSNNLRAAGVPDFSGAAALALLDVRFNPKLRPPTVADKAKAP